MPARIVIDTCVYVSGFIYPASVPRQAIVRAWGQDVPLLLEPVWQELNSVFRKPKLTRFIEPAVLQGFLDQAWAISELVAIPSPIRACRDPRDDKFLELAVHGRADLLLTGDADLLALNPFHGVTVLTPAAFLAG